MDKYKSYIIIALIAMIIPIIYKITVTHHEVNYKVGKYEIKENFQIKQDIHTYSFQISKQKDKYSVRIKNNAHKRKKIIKEIKEYKEKDVKCIIPLYKNTKKVDIYCIKDKMQVSKYSLKDDENYQKILEKAKKYKIKNITTSDTKKEDNKIISYPENIPSKETIIIWDYKGIVGINKEKSFSQKFLDYDLYDNIMATCTSRYFVLFENSSVNGIETIHYYDLKKYKYNQMTLEDKISKDSYINGVENDLIYVTDRKNKKQYAINIKKKTCKEVGNEENDFILYKNHQGKYIPLKDFFQQDHYFQNERIINSKITDSPDLIMEGDYYYFKEEDNFYQQMKDGNKVFLFNEPNIKEWMVQEEELILKREDSIYLYKDQSGLQKVIEYNELKYNDNAIYYLWK